MNATSRAVVNCELKTRFGAQDRCVAVRPCARPPVRLQAPLLAASRCGQAELVQQLLAHKAAVDTVGQVHGISLNKWLH